MGPIDLDEALDGGPGMGNALKRVKEQLRGIPGRGLGYGLLRYLDPEAGPRLAGRPEPQLRFNYLGRFAAGADGNWTAVSEETILGGGADPAMPLPHLVDVTALIMDGPQGPCLSATWTWGGRWLEEPEMQALAQTWRQASRRCAPSSPARLWRTLAVGLPAGGLVASTGGAAGAGPSRPG